MRRNAEPYQGTSRLLTRVSGVVVAAFSVAAMTQCAQAQSTIRPVQPIEQSIQSQSKREEAEQRRSPLKPLATTAQPAPQTAPDGRPLFRLASVDLEGVASLHADELEPAYAAHVGREVSQADLVAIAAAISETYRRAGFHLSRAVVPPQDLKHGRLRIQVIEAPDHAAMSLGASAPGKRAAASRSNVAAGNSGS